MWENISLTVTTAWGQAELGDTTVARSLRTLGTVNGDVVDSHITVERDGVVG